MAFFQAIWHKWSHSTTLRHAVITTVALFLIEIAPELSELVQTFPLWLQVISGGLVAALIRWAQTRIEIKVNEIPDIGTEGRDS
jgi:hypothetical protein